MSDEKKIKYAQVFLRLGIVLPVILFGVFRHLFGWEAAAGSLLESGLTSSFKTAFIIIHVTTVLELGFVVWAIFGKLNNYFVGLVGVLFCLYSFSFLIAIGNESYPKADLSSVSGLPGYPLAILVLLFTLIGVFKMNNNTQVLPVWITVILTILLVGGYGGYYYSPTVDALSDKGNDYEVKYANWDKYWNYLGEQQPDFLEEQNYTVCFFSTSCSHCNDAARLIGVYKRKSPDIKILGVFFAKSADQEFWENDSVVNVFLTRNNLKIPFLKMIDYEAVSIADNQFPVIVEMENKQPGRIYVGSELNAWAFDHLFLPH